MHHCACLCNQVWMNRYHLVSNFMTFRTQTQPVCKLSIQKFDTRKTRCRIINGANFSLIDNSQVKIHCNICSLIADEVCFHSLIIYVCLPYNGQMFWGRSFPDKFCCETCCPARVSRRYNAYNIMSTCMFKLLRLRSSWVNCKSFAYWNIPPIHLCYCIQCMYVCFN